jgi:hypothetical protein
MQVGGALRQVHERKKKRHALVIFTYVPSGTYSKRILMKLGRLSNLANMINYSKLRKCRSKVFRFMRVRKYFHLESEVVRNT